MDQEITPAADPPKDGGRKIIDWEAIEREYRAGILTLRAIAGQHGITEGAIRKRATRDDWSRDLSAKIAAKLDDLVRKESVRDKYASERETVQAAAQLQADYIFKSRKDISRQEEITQRLIEELETCGDDLSKRASINKQLAETRKILIGLQRQALNIKDGESQEENSAATRPLRIELIALK